MIELLEILIISIVQGIGEFLPISSSGHLAVTEHLFQRFGQPLTGSETDFIKLEILLHLGTLVAVLIVFRQRIIDLLKKDFRLIPLLIIGTLPAVVVGLLVKKFAPWIETNLYIISICFAVTGILLIRSRNTDGEKTCSTMTWFDALVIGTMQAIAILPGLSRSGSTIVAGLFRKLRRDEAAVFSFLLAIPVIGGGGILELKGLLKSNAESNSLAVHLLLIGMLVSCVVGIVSLVWLLDWLKKGQLWYFAVWLFIMCPLTLALAIFPLQKTLPEKPNTPSILSAEHNLPTRSQENQLSVQKSTSIPSSEILSQNNVVTQQTDSLTAAIENATESGRENMSQEDAQREYEAILAEEAAKEQAAIAEEQKRIPLVDEPDKLIPLDPKDRIWITPDGRSVIILGRVVLREGFLELLACRIGTKEHESIISVRVKPFLIHAALLAVGAEAGKPVQQTPQFVPPSGDEIEIIVRWNDQDGHRKEVFAQEWVWDAGNSKEDSKKAMSTHWVFTGSMQYKDESGANHYIADESGELFGLSNFVGAILDVPIKSSADNAELLFACFTERIPEHGTPLTLILTPVKNKTRE
ncbi:MAG: undecaprenyl-diphosphate phosphatase [Planctomycetaceae bacterium]|nr:undecaprenyl-diphosphate phosphatase [Planctomycetaceae bacterium]